MTFLTFAWAESWWKHVFLCSSSYLF